MKKTIAVIRGDGIGPEIVNEAIRALDRIATCFGHTFNYIDVWMGGCAIDRFGDSLPDEQLSAAQRSDAVLLGAVVAANLPTWRVDERLAHLSSGGVRLGFSLALIALLWALGLSGTPGFLFGVLLAMPVSFLVLGKVRQRLTGALALRAERKEALRTELRGTDPDPD